MKRLVGLMIIGCFMMTGCVLSKEQRFDLYKDGGKVIYKYLKYKEGNSEEEID